MKIQVLQEVLSKALSITSRFSSSKVQLPVLANILIKSQKNKLLVNATNLDMSISISLGAKIEKEGEITVPTKTISDLVSNLKPGQIELSVEKEKVEINSPGFNSIIAGMNASDFPKIPEVIKNIDFKIVPDALQNALSKVLFAVSVDETRPVLTGVMVLFQKEEVVFVATDGFRLSQIKVKNFQSKKEFRVILPKNILQELIRLMGDGDIEFSYSPDEHQMLFSFENYILSSRVIDGDFPDFEKIIPKKSTTTLVVDRQELLRAVKLASVFARDSANVVKFGITKESIEVVAESSQSGSQKTFVDAKITEGEDLLKDFTIGFNFRFLEDYLNNIEGDDIQINLTDPNAPALFLDLADKNYLHIIMPVRMQG